MPNPTAPQPENTTQPTTHTPETFGQAHRKQDTTDLSPQLQIVDCLSAAPAPKPEVARPSVQRLYSGDGANIIVFNFAPGQQLPTHKAAHPITVQALSGLLDFSCGEQKVRMLPGLILHVPAYVLHEVSCPANAPTENILLLTMLTGEPGSD
ncbi:MAG: cupin domain-containing protein [Corynebacterium sp.]|nr:cupin domain-containing protein [Corynebacterium sp.]